MSGGGDDKKPPIALEDDALLGEIEQWGDMFDALHEEESQTGVHSPAASPPPAEMALAVPIAEAAPATLDPMETDFSDLGLDAAPEALGSLLGSPPPLQEVEDARAPAEAPRRSSRRPITVNEEEEVFTSAPRGRPSALAQAPTDEELFGELPEPPAPAPAPSIGIPATPVKNVRTGPAIVRRDELDKKKEREEAARVAALDSPRDADEHADDAFAGPESTRVASLDEIGAHSARSARRTDPPPAAEPRGKGRAESDFGTDDDSGVFASPEATKIADVAELERLANENKAARAADAAAAAAALLSEPSPSIELTVDDEFYADFEIGDRDEEAAQATQARRATTSHVVRREPTRAVGGPVVEIEAEPSEPVQSPVAGEIGDAVPRVEAAPEDDFSDVAQAIGEAAVVVAGVPVEVSPEEDFSGLAEEVAAAPLTPSAVEPIQDEPGDFDDEDSEPEMAAAPAPGPSPDRARRPTTLPPPKAEPVPELPAAVFGQIEPELDLDAINLPESVDPTVGFDPAEEATRTILVYERELETVDDAAVAAALRCEAGRLYERIGDGDRARFHYEAALLHDPRSFTAMRGLRRTARAAGDLAEATRQLDTEIGIAGTLERRGLALHRVDLLLASGEQDMARVAVGELLDQGAGDVRALLAQLELSFLDGRVEELGDSLERLAGALSDADLRGALGVALGHLRERAGEGERARAAFAAAHESAPGAAAAVLGLRRTGEPAQVVAGTAALAEGIVGTQDAGPGAAEARAAAAGICLRTAGLAAGADLPEVAAGALARARALAGDDPLIAEALWGAAANADVATRIEAITQLGEVAVTSAERTWALAHQATLRLARDGEGDAEAAAAALARAAVADPAHDHVTAAHEEQLATAGDWAGVADLALARVAADPTAERDRVTAARALAAGGSPESVDRAVALLVEGRTLAPGSATLADVLADALAVAGRWSDRVTLWSEIAGSETEREQLDPELAALRAAAAAEEAVAVFVGSEGVGSEGAESPDPEALRRATTAAFEAWTKVVEFDAESQRAHAAAIAMARRLGDRDILGDALARAQAGQYARTGAAAVTLGLERARLMLDPERQDLGRADEILRELPGDDPRRLAASLAVAARAGRWSDAALVLEERAGTASEAGATLEAVMLRYRAAQLLVDRGDDLPRAAQLLGQVLEDRPQLTAAADALSAARRRLGATSGQAGTAAPVAMRATAAELGSGADAFARLVREAEVLSAQGEAHGAIALLTRALELRSADPLATAPLERIARAAAEPAPITRLALEELQAAEAAEDPRGRADAYEALARIDAEVRGDVGSAVVAWESAVTADPSRHWVLRQLARAYAAAGRAADLFQVRGKQIAALGEGPDGVALGLDRAAIGEKEGVDDDELRTIYQDVVARDPRQRIALFHLESLVRRGGSSPELAELELKIADLHGEDPRARAAFLARSGETLVDLGQIEPAIERFRAADQLSPGYVPALHGWRFAALKGQMWLDVAEAATREAQATTDDIHRASLYHLAGVALMDRALVGERAVPVLRKALAADPRHHDAFVRLRILLDEQGEQEELARLLEERLVHEDERLAKMALHRALADLYRNFLGDRESAKYNLRAILELEPNDLRAVATLSDICWEQGAWAEAAEALVTRAHLERDPVLLRQLYYRLGTIYADRIPEPQLALKAFQRVLAADPEDVDALERIADLGIATGEWRMALGACERLVKGEADSERKVSHLHRVGRIFLEGFHDKAKAERAYRMALDATPTSDAALSRLVQFYQEQGDLRSVRMHIDRVAMLMRARLEKDPDDGAAARVISRAMAVRQGAGVMGSIEVARAAAELARALGAAEDPELALAGQSTTAQPGNLAPLRRPEADDLIFPRSVPSELRQILSILGERIAKHVGVDLRPYGVTRGDRLRVRENPVATIAQEVADQLGLGEIDVYVSARQPLVMQAEPTSPVSLVIGAQLAESAAAVRFAAGAALELARAHLAIFARMADAELAALTVALLRLFVPDLPYLRVDEAQVAAQLQKLKRLIPSNLLTELRPYALALDAGAFDHEAFQRGVIAGGLRAGVRAGGSLGVAVQVIAAQRGITDQQVLMRDPLVREVIAFAIGEDHARLVQLSE